jgi:hypothetical protein
MPNVAIADTGKLVRTIFEAGSQYFKKSVAFYSQSLSEADKLATIGKRMLGHRYQNLSQINIYLGYNIPTSYQKSSSSEFQRLLRSHNGLSEEIALDFTEQLMIFEECGNVYASEAFVQASEVRINPSKNGESGC